jgi:hypothetical protein
MRTIISTIAPEMNCLPPIRVRLRFITRVTFLQTHRHKCPQSRLTVPRARNQNKTITSIVTQPPFSTIKSPQVSANHSSPPISVRNPQNLLPFGQHEELDCLRVVPAHQAVLRGRGRGLGRARRASDRKPFLGVLERPQKQAHHVVHLSRGLVRLGGRVELAFRLLGFRKLCRENAESRG